MRLKADWFPYIHAFRAHEFSLIFDRFPLGSFERALELGAGDGFQTQMLAPYTKSLVSTDLRQPPVQPDPRVEVRALPAEQVADVFPPGAFDLVYSSNMLEHVPDAQVVLRAVATVMADDGISVHVMPNVAWKVSQLALYVPHLVATAADELVRERSGRAVMARLGKFRGPPGHDGGATEKNNPTVVRAPRSLVRKALTPEPHGVSSTHREELAAFSRRRWEAEFGRAGFELVAVLNGPFSSGYGFGLGAAAHFLEHRGVGSEYAYVVKKAGQSSRHEALFN